MKERRISYSGERRIIEWTMKDLEGMLTERYGLAKNSEFAWDNERGDPILEVVSDQQTILSEETFGG